jgi:hypothetical protein
MNARTLDHNGHSIVAYAAYPGFWDVGIDGVEHRLFAPSSIAALSRAIEIIDEGRA